MFWFLIVFACILLAQDEELILDASNAEALAEMAEERTINLESLLQIRFTGTSEQQSWHIKNSVNKGQFQFGSSVKNTAPGLQLERFFLHLKFSNWRITGGSIRSKFGHGLQNASAFQPFKNPSNLKSFFNLHNQNKAILSSIGSSNLRGLLIEHTGNRHSFYTLAQKDFLQESVYYFHNSLRYQFSAGNFALLHSRRSIDDKIRSSMSFSGEYEISELWIGGEVQKDASGWNGSGAVSLLHSNTKMVIGGRYLQANRQNIFGKSYSLTGENEKAVLLALHFPFLKWKSSFHTEIAVENSATKFAEKRREFVFQCAGRTGLIRHKLQYKSLISSEWRNVQIQNLQREKWLESQKSQFTWQLNSREWGKSQLLLKMVSLRRELHLKSKGILLQFRAPLINFLGSLKFGVIFFKIDDWDTRIYASSDRLPKEFRIRAYYGNGLGAFLQHEITMKGIAKIGIRFAHIAQFSEGISGNSFGFYCQL